MVTILADNCYTPLGQTSSQNVAAVLESRSALRPYNDSMAAVITDDGLSIVGYNRFETRCIHSITEALRDCDVEPSADDVIFVVSSTKGDIEHLGNETFRCLHDSALLIARYFGNGNEPIVISNACTSGVCAMITAMRMLQSGEYQNAIVVGADIVSEFVFSGFRALKALSSSLCRPFDASRDGLNLGEAAATVVLGAANDNSQAWHLVCGSIHNDANHISGPSRTGEGSYKCLRDVMQGVDKDDLALISCHGTGTIYNDEMESIALHRAGLDDIAVNSLKGYYGHTLGAAGLLETIVNMHAVERGYVPAVPGYEKCGTSFALNISDKKRLTDKRKMVKLISGFGGTNAALLLQYGL